MLDGLYIFEDFYENPDQIRDYALTLVFNVKGNYPGLRTEAYYEEHRSYLKKFFEENVLKQKINYWPGGYNTAFQYTTKEDTTWIHHDDTTWAGILYLTPDAPVESGTSFHRHKDTGIFCWDRTEDTDLKTNKKKEWEEIAFVGNIYNRLIVYRGGYYHRSKVAGFGTDKSDGRLFQTFFFDT